MNSAVGLVLSGALRSAVTVGGRGEASSTVRGVASDGMVWSGEPSSSACASAIRRGRTRHVLAAQVAILEVAGAVLVPGCSVHSRETLEVGAGAGLQRPAPMSAGAATLIILGAGARPNGLMWWTAAAR